MRHDEDRQQYVWLLDGAVVAHLDYRTDGARTVVHHTYTEPRRRGEGIAARLVRAALDDLGARGAQVVPTCWFVADFIDAHPEYRTLLAA